MFGLSWDRIFLVLIVLVFVVGPERIPTAVSWVTSSLRKLRGMAAGAQAELRSQIGPELDELRRQVADLQSLKELSELRALRDLNPKNIITKNILGEEFSGGLTGFLGLSGTSQSSATDGPDADAVASDAASDARTMDTAIVNDAGTGAAPAAGDDLHPAGAASPEPALIPATGGSADSDGVVPRFDLDAT